MPRAGLTRGIGGDPFRLAKTAEAMRVGDQQDRPCSPRQPARIDGKSQFTGEIRRHFHGLGADRRRLRRTPRLARQPLAGGAVAFRRGRNHRLSCAPARRRDYAREAFPARCTTKSPTPAMSKPKAGRRRRTAACASSRSSMSNAKARRRSSSARAALPSSRCRRPPASRSPSCSSSRCTFSCSSRCARNGATTRPGCDPWVLQSTSRGPTLSRALSRWNGRIMA